MMRAAQLFPNVLIIGLILSLAGSVGLGLAQGLEPAVGDAEPQGVVSISATVGSKFSYQGVLKENDSPVSGSRDMTFRLYSDETCTTQLGSDIDKPGVQVTNGLFNVELQVVHSTINGQGLWLQVEVDDTQIGCQEILPVPYALSLRPGALIQGAESSIKLAYLNEGQVSTEVGVEAISLGTDINTVYYGLHGVGTDYGVLGSSPNGSGIYGSSTNGAALYGNGDVKQNLPGNGLVKAAVYVDCNDDFLLSCIRSFNNVNNQGVFCSPGNSDGRCTIDFGFDVNERYWVASAVGGFGYGVTCELGSSNQELDCVRWSGADGTGLDGNIMVLVY
jgi:hypothetical protein